MKFTERLAAITAIAALVGTANAVPMPIETHDLTPQVLAPTGQATRPAGPRFTPTSTKTLMTTVPLPTNLPGVGWFPKPGNEIFDLYPEYEGTHRLTGASPKPTAEAPVIDVGNDIKDKLHRASTLESDSNYECTEEPAVLPHPTAKPDPRPRKGQIANETNDELEGQPKYLNNAGPPVVIPMPTGVPTKFETVLVRDAQNGPPFVIPMPTGVPPENEPILARDPQNGPPFVIPMPTGVPPENEPILARDPQNGPPFVIPMPTGVPPENEPILARDPQNGPPFVIPMPTGVPPENEPIRARNPQADSSGAFRVDSILIPASAPAVPKKSERSTPARTGTATGHHGYDFGTLLDEAAATPEAGY